MNRLPVHIANSIYEILVAEAGASESESARHSFRYTFCSDNQPGRNYEFRFGGILGFAGKFWWNNDRFYVTGHSRGDLNTGGCTEADLEYDNALAERVNALLAVVYREFEQYRLRVGMLEAIPAFQQHQGSLTEQLQLLAHIANKVGLHDASDFITRSLER